jgi:hypothetical protein
VRELQDEEEQQESDCSDGDEHHLTKTLPGLVLLGGSAFQVSTLKAQGSGNPENGDFSPSVLRCHRVGLAGTKLAALLGSPVPA